MSAEIVIADNPKKSSAKRHIDQDIFENLCRIMCTRDEICSVLGVDFMTLKKWCKRTYGKTIELVMMDYQADGKASFRRLGLRLAEQGSAPVWIFLAKNWLGMADNPAPAVNGDASKDFARAINSASKALAKMDIGSMAQIPDGGGSDA